MEEATFEKVEQSEERMHGQKGMIVCGYPPSEHRFFLMFMEKAGFNDRPVLFARTQDGFVTLKDLLASDTELGIGEPSEMPRALILSGFTRNELYKIMSAYRYAGLPAQLWATLTPVSETWTLGRLLEELVKEDEAIRDK